MVLLDKLDHVLDKSTIFIMERSNANIQQVIKSTLGNLSEVAKINKKKIASLIFQNLFLIFLLGKTEIFKLCLISAYFCMSSIRLVSIF